MRNTEGAVRRYSVGIVPVDLASLVVFLTTELKNIESALNNNADGFLELITVAPDKPRAGMYRFAAAGVLGVGEGFYIYHGGVWVFLG
jgi:hypothetical protein